MNTVAGTKLKELKQTCFACPSQWEGRTTDGRFVYVRFRHGRLSVGIANTFFEAIRQEDYVDMHGDHLDGFITTEEMLDRTGMIL